MKSPLNRMKALLLRRAAVRDHVEVGSNFHVGPRSVIWAPSQLRIGRDVYVGKNVTIEVDGVIGDGVMIANNVGIVGRRDHDIRDLGNPIRLSRWVGDSPDQLSLPIHIGADVWIGFGAVVLSGVQIGDSAIVAAGSVVRSDVAPNSIVSGNPSKPIGNRFEEAELTAHWFGLRASGVRLSKQDD